VVFLIDYGLGDALISFHGVFAFEIGWIKPLFKICVQSSYWFWVKFLFRACPWISYLWIMVNQTPYQGLMVPLFHYGLGHDLIPLGPTTLLGATRALNHCFIPKIFLNFFNTSFKKQRIIFQVFLILLC